MRKNKEFKNFKNFLKYPIFKFFCLIGKSVENFLNKKICKDKISKILIYQTGGIGDILRIFPAIEVLKNNFPNASFTLLTGYGKELYNLLPDSNFISDYIIERQYRGFLKKLLLIYRLRKKSFDLIFAPARGSGMIEDNIIVTLIGAPYRIGFKKNGAGFLNTLKVEFKENQSILKQNLELLKKAGLVVHITNIHLTLKKEDEIFISNFLNKYNINSEKIITIHLSSYYWNNIRSWPLDNFINLIYQIINHFQNLRIIILGSKDEIFIKKQINEKIKHPKVINIIGQTTLSQMSAIIKYSHLFIGNDSGPLHIARAFKIPSIGIFGPTSPKQVISDWENFIPVQKKLPCVPCYLHQPFFKPKCKEPLCLTSLSVDEVWTAVETMLKKVICLNMT